MVGPSAEELESLKELIRFDHEYVKRPPVPAPFADIELEKTAPAVAKPLAKAPAQAPARSQACDRAQIPAQATVQAQATATAQAQAPVAIIDIDEEDEAVSSSPSPSPPPLTKMELDMDLFPAKAEAALQDMLVSLKSASLAVSNAGDDAAAVPNLLSIQDCDSGVFDCDFSDLLSVGTELGSCDSKSESGWSEVGSSVDSAFGETPGSPLSDYSDMSPNLSDNIWEESFTNLFPSLDYL